VICKGLHENVEDLAWTSEKRGGGDIIDLLIRACFIRGLYDERIKTMVKTKGCINTPMAQLVEIALEEECAIKSERFRRNYSDRGQFMNKGSKNVVKIKQEPAEVRVAIMIVIGVNRKDIEQINVGILLHAGSARRLGTKQEIVNRETGNRAAWTTVCRYTHKWLHKGR
jgi:hypothetical protein